MKIYFSSKLNDYVFTNITSGIYKNIPHFLSDYKLLGDKGYVWIPVTLYLEGNKFITEIKD